MNDINPKFDCTVIGDICLDITVQASIDDIDIPIGGADDCDLIKASFGGAGNVAVGLSLLGAKVALVGKAGRDISARICKSELRKNGIMMKISHENNLHTGIVLAFVDEKKERSFLVFRGANKALSENDIHKADKVIQNSKYLCISGFSFVSDSQRSAILSATRIAKKNNVKVVFDPGSYNIIKDYRNYFQEILNNCDIVSPNFKEALAITNSANLKDAIRTLSKAHFLTALKRGANGSVLINGNKIVKTPAYRVDVVDTTGAGDAFTSAVIYGLNREMSLESIGKLANWFASQVIVDFGGRSFPSKIKIKRFLRAII